MGAGANDNRIVSGARQDVGPEILDLSCDKAIAVVQTCP
jgi:hypothetical protein